MDDSNHSPISNDVDPHPTYAGRLKRLQPTSYEGHVSVHWTMCVEGRATGWLTERLHLRVRETLLHACVRFKQICPTYCLLPDHAHFLLLGVAADADSRDAVRLLRRGWNADLRPAGHTLQRQAFDHVLRPRDRMQGAFQGVADYILENPVRAGLVAERNDWPYGGCLFPGYPSLNPAEENFWPSFWRAHGCVAGE